MLFDISVLEADKKDRKKECFYCKKMITHISTHLERLHTSEEKVKEILSLENKVEKSKKLTKLGNLGDHLYNIKVSKRLHLIAFWLFWLFGELISRPQLGVY